MLGHAGVTSLETRHQMRNPGKCVATSTKRLSWQLLACANRDANPAPSLRLPSTGSNGPQEFKFFKTGRRERYVCFVAHCKRGNSGCLTKGRGGREGEGSGAERAKKGGRVITGRKHGLRDPWAAGEGGSCPPCSTRLRPQRRRAGCGMQPSVKREKTVALVTPADLLWLSLTTPISSLRAESLLLFQSLPLWN